MNQTISFLREIRDRQEYIPYSTIYHSIADMRDKFVPSAKLNKGHYIDRVRINASETDLFTKEEQISYIHDPEIIEKYVGFGRANAEKQAVFYGAVESPEIKQPRVVAYFETSELFRRSEGLPDNVTEIFTLSRWRIMEDIEVMEMIFSDEALKSSEYARMSLAHQSGNYKHLPLAEEYEEQGRFFSNEFSRNDVKKGESHKYKIAAAYANYIWSKTQMRGVTYPSVQSIYKGQNVALLPELVDKYLKLESVGVFKFERKDGVNLPINSIYLATDLGIDNNAFKYIDYKGEDHLPK